MTAETGPRVLVVDDDSSICRVLRSVLTSRGYRVATADSGAAAVSAVENEDVDVVVLDLGLPGMSGFEACGLIRKISDVLVLILSVRDATDDKIQALDMGADDYLTKPFEAGELLARVRALLRRRGDAEMPPLLELGDLQVDLASRAVLKGGEEVSLTPIEWAILASLAEGRGRVVQTKTLIRRVWGPDTEVGPEVLRVHVRNLRRKIEDRPALPKHVITETGVGYRLAG